MMKLLLQAGSALFARLPLPQALALGRGIGWVYGSLVRYHRRDALDALARAFPDKSAAEIRDTIRRMYANLGMNIAELARLPTASDESIRNTISIEGEDIARAALARGKGLLILSAHLGSWDLLCTFVPRLGYPLTIITKDIKNKALNDFWMKIRERFGLKFVPAHNSYRQCLHALKRNELVGFILDQNMIAAEGVFVDFFGRPACTSPGLAYMSAQSGAPVMPVFMVRQEGGRHLIRGLPVVEPPPDRKPETILEFTQRYTRIIEDVVRDHPDQWIWIHRRWRTTPPQAAGGK